MSKTALVMEGGAMRGMFTCGVIDVFMENGITFDAAIGVSAGAAFGCNMKSQQIGRPIRYNKKYCGDRRYASLHSWIHTGDLYNVDFCYGELVNKYDVWDAETFARNPMDFYVVATDIQTGQAYYHKCSDGKALDLQWIRASASIPVASRPVEINQKLYLDGGMSDSIPVKYMQDLGYDNIVVIETQPKEYVKKTQKLMPLIKLFLYKYPNMIRTMRNRHLHYNEEKRYIREQEQLGKVRVIRPECSLKIGAATKNPEELERVYQLGRKAGYNFLKKYEK